MSTFWSLSTDKKEFRERNENGFIAFTTPNRAVPIDGIAVDNMNNFRKEKMDESEAERFFRCGKWFIFSARCSYDPNRKFLLNENLSVRGNSNEKDSFVIIFPEGSYIHSTTDHVSPTTRKHETLIRYVSTCGAVIDIREANDEKKFYIRRYMPDVMIQQNGEVTHCGLLNKHVAVVRDVEDLSNQENKPWGKVTHVSSIVSGPAETDSFLVTAAPFEFDQPTICFTLDMCEGWGWKIMSDNICRFNPSEIEISHVIVL